MSVPFTIEDLLKGKVPKENILVGLNQYETEIATSWFNRLRDVETRNVLGVIGTTQLIIDANNDPLESFGMAIVAAGSSTYEMIYSDIDLFLIPETYSNGALLEHSGLLTTIGNFVQGIPSYFEKGETKWEGLNCVFSFEDYKPGEKTGKNEKAHGKQVQFVFLKDKFDFEFPRDGREGDLTYRQQLSAEQLIELNRRNGTHMVVLARSYVYQLAFENPDMASVYKAQLRVRREDIDSILDGLIEPYKGSSFTAHALRKAMVSQLPGLLWKKYGDNYQGIPTFEVVMKYCNATINNAIRNLTLKS